MNTIYKTISIIFLIFLLAGIGYLIYDRPEGSGLNFGGEASEPRDIFGVTSGTSTIPTTNVGTTGYPTSINSNFSDMTLNIDNGYSTTSKAVILDGQTDLALFTFKALTSSSSAYVYYEIFGTNDTYCDTIATSTTDDNYSASVALTSDITWYNIGADAALVSGTLDDPGDDANSTTTSELLTDLNWKCLKVDLRGASSTVAVQLREKTNN